MPEKEMVLEGVGKLYKDGGRRNSKWDHEAIWGRIRSTMTHKFVNEETGEIDSRSVMAVNQTINLIQKVTNKGTYSTRNIQLLGIDADEVSEVSWGRRKVSISKK